MRLGVIVGLAVFGTGLGRAQPTTENAIPWSTVALPDELQFVPERPSATVVARSSLGEMTLEQLIERQRLHEVPMEPRLAPEQVAQARSTWLARLARQVALDQIGEARMAATQDAGLLADRAARIEAARLTLTLAAVESRVKTSLAEPSSAEIVRYYDEHREDFRRRFQFSMRHIFLGTYRRYVVAEGDTLESIAERVAGDLSRLPDIRSDLGMREPRWVPPEERATRPMRPLQVGEPLLVPMNEAEADEVRRRLETILEQLKEGKPFEELAAAHSEAEAGGQEIGPLPAGTRPMIEELLQAARETPPGQVSPIFRTKHGFQVIQVTEKREEGYSPLETVTAAIRLRLNEERRAALDQALAEELLAAAQAGPGVRLEAEALAQAPRLAPETALAYVGDRAITWGQASMAWPGEARAAADDARPPRWLRRARPFQAALALPWAERERIFEAGEWGERLAVAERVASAQAALSAEVEAKLATLTSDAELQRYYQRHAAEEFTEPETITYQIIELRPGPDYASASEDERAKMLDGLKKRLNQSLERIKTIDDFFELAREINQPAEGPPLPFSGPPPAPLVGRRTPLAELQGPTAVAARELRPGDFSDPYVEAHAVRSVTVIDRTPARLRPFDEVRSWIVSRIRTEARERLVEETQEAWLAESGFEMVLPPDAPPNEPRP